MKITYKVIMAALAAGISLISCTKEKQDVESASEGPRTIEISFAPQTKSALSKEDGLTPEFRPGDEILVSNGKNYDMRPIDFDYNGDASFTTDLSGSLTAVYPAKAAKLDGTEITGVLVPSNQTGRFADANIAMAKISEGASKAYFENQTAVLKFYIGPEIGVQRIIISSNSQLVTENSNIVVEVAKLRESKVIDPQERICYVAVLPGVSQMKVESLTSTQKVENPEGCVTREFQDVKLIHNTLANVFIPYYIPVNVGSESEPEYQYWSYCNIGAFLPEETGKYFAWGATDGYKWLVKNNEGTFEENHPFIWENCPFNDGKSEYSQEAFEAQETTVCPNGALVANYDAAYLSWGGKWSMPTNEEIEKLYSIITPLEDVSEDGLKIKGTSLFFPLTGYGFVQDRPKRQWTDSGMYWTSSLNVNNKSEAYCFHFTQGHEIAYIEGNYWRCLGMPIRPIYKITGLTVESYQKGKDL